MVLALSKALAQVLVGLVNHGEHLLRVDTGGKDLIPKFFVICGLLSLYNSCLFSILVDL